jgi:peptide/nickel transport system ATP-binding protein
MDPLLRIQQLSVDFETESGLVPALKKISFIVHPNEIVALVGESGSGKSVTALSILQLLPSPPARYSNGSILFGEGGKETDLLKLAAPGLQFVRGNKIAMIFQEPMTSLNPVLTCGQQVMEAILAHKKTNRKEAREKTIDWFTRVRLPEPSRMFNRYPHELSGGQKQRVMIAMAMCCEPSLLICDEPTTALDVTVQKTILELIRELQKQTGMGVIFITHDLGVVAEVADRAIVMYKGDIVEENTVEKIFQSPKHPYTKGLIACRPVNHPRGERLPVVNDFIGGHSSTVAVKPAIVSPPISYGSRLLSAENLSVHFPANRALFGKPRSFIRAVDNVSFEVYEGETLGLVGESGCGKTTLGRTLLRLIQPSTGRIIYKGIDLAHIRSEKMREMRKDLQIIFQDPYSSLNPRITIGASIMEPMKVHHLFRNDKERKERMIEMLKKVNLEADHHRRYPHEFSGGQRQRIVIARALVLSPSFVVCDESVSALDVSVQAQVLNLLNDLKKEFGFTVIFISHDLSVVRYISDRIMVMNKGKIEETGAADQVYFHPVSDYTRALISSVPKGIARA